MSSLATTTAQNSAQNEDGSATDQRLRDFEDKLRKLFPKKGYIISLRDPQLHYYKTETRYHGLLKSNCPNCSGVRDGEKMLLIVYHEIDIQCYIHLFDYYGDGQEDGVSRGCGFIGEAGKLFKEYEDVVGWRDDEECPGCAAFVYTKHISTKKRKLVDETTAGTSKAKRKLNDDSPNKKGKPKRIVGSSSNAKYTDEVFQNFLKDRKRRKNFLLSGLENLKAIWKAKLKDGSQNKKWKREYFFNYNGEHQNDKEPRKDFLYGLGSFMCGIDAFEEFCESVGCCMANEREALFYEDCEACPRACAEGCDEPQIDWGNDNDDIKHAEETILNDILDHLSEGKSVAIGNWSDEYEIPLTIHDFNVGTMGAQEIYKRLSTREKKCKSMQIVPCTAEPFLGCHIICDEHGGQKLNRMASYFLKNQVYGGKLYGNVLLTRHVD